MRILALSLLASCLACGPVADEVEGVEEQSLGTDPWQNIFASRGTNGSFVFNPLGTMTLLCPDDVYRTECPLQRLNLARAGFSISRQQAILNRLAGEVADEARASVFLKGLFITVRDHRTDPPTTYVEFRVSAAHQAPGTRVHATSVLYVTSDVDADGFQTARSVNSDLLPRGVSLSFRVRFRWVGPLAQTPSRYPVDSFVSVSAYRIVPGGGGLGPFEMDVDQRFTRIPLN